MPSLAMHMRNTEEKPKAQHHPRNNANTQSDKIAQVQGQMFYM